MPDPISIGSGIGAGNGFFSGDSDGSETTPEQETYESRSDAAPEFLPTGEGEILDDYNFSTGQFESSAFPIGPNDPRYEARSDRNDDGTITYAEYTQNVDEGVYTEGNPFERAWRGLTGLADDLGGLAQYWEAIVIGLVGLAVLYLIRPLLSLGANLTEGGG